MNIQPLTPNRFNNYTTSYSYKKSHYKFQSKNITDSISFSSSYDYLQNEKENLNNILKKEIIPFIKDAKEPLTQIGFIGYNAQNKLEIFNKEEENFLKKKYFMPIPNENKNYKLINTIIKKYEDYQDNIKRYEDLVRMVDYKGYNTATISEQIGDKKLVFSEIIPEATKIQELKNYAKKNTSKILEESKNITLKQEYPELFEKKNQLNEQRIRAIYYLLKTPLKKAIWLKTQIEQLTNCKKNHYELQNEIEILYKEIFNLNEEKSAFYKNQEEILTFVSQNQNTQMPSNNLIKNAYKTLNKKYDDVLEKYLNDTEIYFQNQFNINSAPKTIQTLDEALEKQNKVIKQLKNLIISQNKNI